MKVTLLILAAGFLSVPAFATIRYVDANNTNPLSPYTSWTTAAVTIQDAVDVAEAGDEVVVTNGTYATGGRAGYGTTTNRVAIDKPLAVRSVNGPLVTVIQGYQVPGTTNGDGAIRCVYLADGASLSGFTLTQGATRSVLPSASDGSGGGASCALNAVLSNCWLTGNSAMKGGGAAYGTLLNCILSSNSAQWGGGMADGKLLNCTLTGNSATEFGGGAYGGTLVNCLVTSNSASYGGGGYGYRVFVFVSLILSNCTVVGNSATNASGGTGGSMAYNSIIYYNTAPSTPNGQFTLNCCSPEASASDITNEPAFIDLAAGNLRLQSNSPCINAGNYYFAPNGVDRDGNQRVVGGTVDIGAYEFQSPQSIVSYAWLQQYGLATDGSADYADLDADGHNNWQEWRCRTIPTNHNSVLRLLTPSQIGISVKVSWQSVAGVNYYLERSPILSPPLFTPLAVNLEGQAGTTSYTNINVVGKGPYYYRIGVMPLPTLNPASL